MKKKKGHFSISAVAEMFSVHQQTIRLYEREGLICPRRSEGNTRLFSESDIERLEEIIYLTHKLGINLAGVEMILKQQKKIEKLQKEMNTLFKRIQKELEEEKNNINADAIESMRHLSNLKKKQNCPQGKQKTLETKKDLDGSK